MDPQPEKISCVIPVLNEAGAVVETLKGVSAALGKSGHPFEILLVDDGSTDGTAEAAAKSGVAFRALRHSRNRGYGAAIKTGCRAAAGPWILIIDADGTYPPEAIGPLAEALRADPPPDMVVGQRTQTLATDGFFRLQAKAILLALANFLSGIKIPDLNSGLRLMRKADLERRWPLLPEGFSLTTTMTLALLCSGAEVGYVPIEYRRREGKSKIRPLRDMGNFIILIIRTMLYFNPLKVFLPLAGLLVAGSLATAIMSKVITHRVMDVTTLFLFIAGLQMLLIGVIADLSVKSMGMRDR